MIDILARLMKFDLTVVLCGGSHIDYEKYDNYGIINGKKVYIGGLNRLKVAIDIEEYSKIILLIGGTKEKVVAMKNYLINNSHKLAKRKDDIKLLVSGSSTYANIVALNRYIEENIDGFAHIGIVSSFYHFTRIYAFLFDAMSSQSHYKANFVPIPSELVIHNSINDELLLPMIDLESKGIVEFKQKTYKHIETKYELL
jgi:hypothetical protein